MQTIEAGLRRAPMGGESIFYAHDGTRWVMSSRLSEIARETHAGVNLGALARWIALLDEPGSGTVFANVHRLLPCQSLTVTSNGIDVKTDIPLEGPTLTGSLDELAITLRQHLDATVHRATAGSRNAGIMVGGVDSCGLAALTIASGAPVTLLTITHRGTDPDEPYVDELARMYDRPLLKVSLDEGGSLVDSFLLVDGLPFPAPAYQELTAARALRDAGADRVLTGFMGDDVFGGHPSMIGTRMLPRHPLRAIHEAVRLRTPDGGSIRSRVVDFLVRPHARRLLPASIRARRRRAHLAKRFHWTRPPFLELLEAGSAEQESRYHVPSSGRELFRLLATMSTLADMADIRSLLDAQRGLRQLDPFVDLALARFTTSLPYEVLNCDTIHRGLYRRALRGLVPESTLRRVTKSIMDEHIFEVIKRELDTPRWRERFSVPHLARLGWVDPIAFRASAERLRSSDDLIAVWPFLSADAFLERA